MSGLKKFINGFQSGIKKFGEGISVIINSILLFIAYIIGVGITFIGIKIFRKRLIDTKISKKESYWSDLNLKKKPIEEYYRQF